MTDQQITTDEVRRLYDGFASWWRWAAIPDTLLGVNRMRQVHFSGLAGDVLDVACGTGENFKYLTKARSVTAVDLSPNMVERARSRARSLGIDGRLAVADAAALPYPEDSFDHAISALSSCTFPHHVSAFREMERVTRPGGSILLLEHGRSEVGWIARRQDRNAAKHLSRAACRSNRDPRGEIEEAGLEISDHQRTHLGMVHRFVIEVG